MHTKYCDCLTNIYKVLEILRWKNNFHTVPPTFLLWIFGPKWEGLTSRLGSSATRIMMKSVDIKLVTPRAEWWFILGCRNAAANLCPQETMLHHPSSLPPGNFLPQQILVVKVGPCKEVPTSFWWVKSTEVFSMQHPLVGFSSHGRETLVGKAAFLSLISRTYPALVTWPE